MKRIILVFSLLVGFLFSFSSNKVEINNKQVELLSNENENCNIYDSIVNITTINNLINVSGFIVYKDTSFIYIATSLVNYNKEYNYEIVFDDYSRRRASIVGIANEDEILLLKVSRNGERYCSVRLSKSEFIDKLERVEIIGKYNYSNVTASAYINSIGVCRNCNEFTYKNYYSILLSVDISDYLLGAGVFNKRGQLLGIVTSRMEKYNIGISMLDVNKLVAICYNLINDGVYQKNYIKYNLLDVNSLTNHEKYLYSLDKEVKEGVLVSSVHYLNYFIGGLNQGMVIIGVNGESVKNCYELDNKLSKYGKGSYVYLNVRTILNSYKTYRVKI